jgi:hypothetical protein
LRPKRVNCTPPAIEQFPPPLMPAWFRTVSCWGCLCVMS